MLVEEDVAYSDAVPRVQLIIAREYCLESMPSIKYRVASYSKSLNRLKNLSRFRIEHQLLNSTILPYYTDRDDE